MTRLYMADFPNGALLTPAILDVFKARGIEVLGVGLQYPHAPYATGTARENFEVLDAYGWPKRYTGGYFENQGADVVEQHVPTSRLASCGFLAVAVEPGGGFTTKEAIDAALADADTFVGAGRAIVYGSPWSIAALGLNGVDYSARRGWCANYRLTPDAPALPFAGIPAERIVAVQYNGRAFFPGVPFAVDLSWIEEDALTNVIDIQKDSTDDAKIAEIKDAVRTLTTDGEQFIGSAQGPGTVVQDVPEGYEVIVALRKVS